MHINKNIQLDGKKKAGEGNLQREDGQFEMSRTLPESR